MSNENLGSYKWRCSDKNCPTPCTLDSHCKGLERPGVCPYTEEPVLWEKRPDKNFGSITVSVTLIAPEKEINEAGEAIKILHDFMPMIDGPENMVKYAESLQKVLNLIGKIESKESIKP